MNRDECLAMILAGGQGSRLGVLTEDVAKPAVPFAGKYRIIDFTLSNCTHSNISTVGVLTQYQPLELNTYIGNGGPWDLDRNRGGVFVLPPYVKTKAGEWYKGTANAIYQNISFIEKFSPKYILVLSGDHIYKMDYRKMLRYHIDTAASATIAVMEVPWEEASRFGIMNTDKDNVITEFYEKPAKPVSNKASMGIYVFKWDILREYLIMDEQNKKSSNDFGKDIIPEMLKCNEKMVAYRFDGYWKDVGTIQSLWEANMDIIASPPRLSLYDPDWKIFSRNPIKPPHFIAEGAKIISSCITEGCSIYGYVENCVLSESVFIGKNAVVKDSVIFPNVKINDGAYIEKAIIGTHAVIGKDCVIGKEYCENNPHISTYCSEGIVVIKGGINIPDNTVVYKNSMIKTSISNGGQWI